jgi:dTDP-4-amino-4,6-dideoxygalactose transaminase
MTTTATFSIPVMRPWIGAAEADAAAAAVASGWLAQGPRVAAFETAFAQAVGAREAVAVSSCTTGLHLALVALGIGAGDDVVVPSFSFIATANAVTYTGARPVFADVEITTGNLTASTIAAALTPQTRAVMVVHQAGVPVDLQEVYELCLPLGIAVLEDAACAAGSQYRGAMIGSASDFAIFSFHPRKVLTTGEGGMIVTRNAEWAARLRRLREHGMSVSAADRHAGGIVAPEQYLEIGFNYRMTDVQAAVGMVQLNKLPTMVQRRRELAQVYHDAFADLAHVRCVTDPAFGRTNYQSFWIEFNRDAGIDRDDAMEELRSRGISPRRGIMAAHLEPAYAGVEHVPLPVTEHLTRHTMILPLFHEMTAAEQAHVITAVRSVAQ